MARGDALRAGDVALEVTHIDGARQVDERNQDIEAGASQAVETSEALYHHNLGLADNLERFGRDENAEYDDYYEYSQSKHRVPLGYERIL
jgi:hypothetical protein